jgi:hypothetical protein
MGRFAVRHWTAILVILILAGWAVFYLPNTPSFAIYQLKQAVDARDGNGAARFIDFQQVVRNAGDEMTQDDSGSGSSAPDIIGQIVRKGAVELFSGPMAALLKQWAIQQVDDGAHEVQMPPAAVAGSILMLHRNQDNAFTQFQDKKGQVWGVRLQRENGEWKVIEVKNVKQLLDRLKHQQEQNFNSTTPATP